MTAITPLIPADYRHVMTAFTPAELAKIFALSLALFLAGAVLFEANQPKASEVREAF